MGKLPKVTQSYLLLGAENQEPKQSDSRLLFWPKRPELTTAELDGLLPLLRAVWVITLSAYSPSFLLSTCSTPHPPTARPASLHPLATCTHHQPSCASHRPSPQPVSCGDDFSWQRRPRPFSQATLTLVGSQHVMLPSNHSTGVNSHPCATFSGKHTTNLLE